MRKLYSEQEDRILRKYCQLKTAEEIGVMIGRSKDSVHNRIQKLGLSGRKYGEHHWRAKHDDVFRLAIATMYDGGMTPMEIKHVVNTAEDIKLDRIKSICYGRG